VDFDFCRIKVREMKVGLEYFDTYGIGFKVGGVEGVVYYCDLS
jgi:hypothetical protein